MLDAMIIRKLEGTKFYFNDTLMRFLTSASHLPLARRGGEGYLLPAMDSDGNCYMFKFLHNATNEMLSKMKQLRAKKLYSLNKIFVTTEIEVFQSSLVMPGIEHAINITGYRMPFLQGDTLRSLFIDGWNPSLEDRIRLSIELCVGITLLEGMKLIHRDLSPANIIILQGKPGLHIIDFDGHFIEEYANNDNLQCKSYVGLPGYTHRVYNTSDVICKSFSDRMALAVIVFEMMVCGHFYLDHLYGIGRDTLLNQFDIDRGKLVLPDAFRAKWPSGWNLLERAVQVNSPLDAPTPAEWIECLLNFKSSSAAASYNDASMKIDFAIAPTRISVIHPMHIILAFEAGPYFHKYVEKIVKTIILELQCVSRGIKPYFRISLVATESKGIIMVNALSVNSIGYDEIAIGVIESQPNWSETLSLIKNNIKETKYSNKEFPPLILLILDGKNISEDDAVYQNALNIRTTLLPCGSPRLAALALSDCDINKIQKIVDIPEYLIPATSSFVSWLWTILPSIGTPDTSRRQSVRDKNKIISLFYGYAPEDERMCVELEKHLAVLQQQNLITEWHRGKVRPGEEKDLQVEHYLGTSDIIILLISSSFLANKDYYQEKIDLILERHKNKTARVIPLLARPTLWKETPLGILQPLPKNEKPISSWKNKDDAWHAVADEILHIIKEIQSAK